jgi:hypothetical protein
MRIASARSLNVTFMRSAAQPKGVRKIYTAAELLDDITKPIDVISATKEDHPLVSLCTYKNNYRNADNVEHVAGVQLDFDGISLGQLKALVRSIREQNLASSIFSTWRHTPASKRLRAVFVAERDIMRSEYSFVWAGLVNTLECGDFIDRKSSDVSRGFFMPIRVEGFFSRRYDGVLLDVNEMFDRGQITLGPQASIVQASGIGRPAFSKGSEVVTDEQIDELRSALKFIDANDRQKWIDTLHSLKAIAHPKAFDLAVEYSRQSDAFNEPDANGQTGEQMVLDRWIGINPTSRTYRSIFHEAGENGWLNPAAKPEPKALDEVIAQVRTLTLEDLGNAEKWCSIVVDAQLYPSQQDDVVQTIYALTHGKRGLRALRGDLRTYRERVERADAEKRVEESARGRARITYNEAEPGQMVDEAERAVLVRQRPGDQYELLSFAGTLTFVTDEQPRYAHSIIEGEQPPPQVGFKAHNRTTLTMILDRHIQHEVISKGGPVPIAPPEKTITHLLGAASTLAPIVTGLSTHQIVRLNDGRVIREDGIDEQTRLYVRVDPELRDVEVLRGHDAARAAYRFLAEELFGEFAFDADVDQAMAIALLITTLVRRMLPEAPMFIAHAKRQGTGKTTLVRFVKLTVTGQEMAVYQLPGDGEESRKLIHTILMGSPGMVVFDNVSDGSRISGEVLAACITNPVFSARVLGISEERPVPTNTTFVVTGNNLEFDNDFSQGRVAEIRLDTKGEQPDKRSFTHADYRSRVLRLRRDSVSAALTIVHAYIVAGLPTMRAPATSRMPMWERYVRNPILWAGGIDISDSISRTRSESAVDAEDEQVLEVLFAAFSERGFTPGEIVERGESASSPLREAAPIERALTAQSPVKALGRLLTPLTREKGAMVSGAYVLTYERSGARRAYRVIKKADVARPGWAS